MPACEPRIPELIEAARGASSGKALEGHLAACAACRAELARLRGVFRAVRAAPAATPSPDFLAKVRREVAVIRKAEAQAAGARHLLSGRPWWRAGWVRAAAACLALAGSFALWRARTPDPFPDVGTPLRVPAPDPAPKAGGGSASALPEPRPKVPDFVASAPEPEPSAAGDLPPLPPSPLPEFPEPEALVAEDPLPESDPSVPVSLPDPGASRIGSGAAALPGTQGAAASGRAWLLAHQNPDGSWGDPVVDQNLATGVQVTSLAVLALAGETAEDASSREALSKALVFLQGHQDPSGFLAPACDKRVLSQSMGTAALAALARTHKAARKPLERSAAALLKLRGVEGWSRDGASTQTHAVATAWALFALGRAREAGVRLPARWEDKPLAGLRRLVDRRTGAAGLVRPGEPMSWAPTVAVGSALAACGRKAEAEALAPRAGQGLEARLAQPLMDAADPEMLVLLGLWVRADDRTWKGREAGLRAAFERWGSGPAPWTVGVPSPWDGLSGDAYGTALGVWGLAIAGPP